MSKIADALKHYTLPLRYDFLDGIIIDQYGKEIEITEKCLSDNGFNDLNCFLKDCLNNAEFVEQCLEHRELLTAFLAGETHRSV
jgi:hypothetical protein